MGGNEAQMVEKGSAYQTSAGQYKIQDAPEGIGLETISESTLKKQYERHVINYSGTEQGKEVFFCENNCEYLGSFAEIFDYFSDCWNTLSLNRIFSIELVNIDKNCALFGVLLAPGKIIFSGLMEEHFARNECCLCQDCPFDRRSLRIELG